MEISDHTLPPLRQYIAVGIPVDDNIVSVLLYTEAIQEVRASIIYRFGNGAAAVVLRLPLRL